MPISQIEIYGAGAAAAYIFKAEAVALGFSAETFPGGKHKFALAAFYILPGKLLQESLLVGLASGLFFVPGEEGLLIHIVIHGFQPSCLSIVADEGDPSADVVEGPAGQAGGNGGDVWIPG